MTEPSVRITHPNLYRQRMTIALLFVALGLCFLLPWIPEPTFEQFGIPSEGIGLGFMVLGLGLLLFLNVLRNTRAVRVVLIAGILYEIFWAIGTTETVFQGKSSPQLFILYIGHVFMQVWALKEPGFNPITATADEEGN